MTPLFEPLVIPSARDKAGACYVGQKGKGKNQVETVTVTIVKTRNKKRSKKKAIVHIPESAFEYLIVEDV